MSLRKQKTFTGLKTVDDMKRAIAEVESLGFSDTAIIVPIIVFDADGNAYRFDEPMNPVMPPRKELRNDA